MNRRYILYNGPSVHIYSFEEYKEVDGKITLVVAIPEAYPCRQTCNAPAATHKEGLFEHAKRRRCVLIPGCCRS